MELLVSLVTAEEQIVLDPFMGSGTTCLVAKCLNRHYIGIDIQQENIEIANQRLLKCNKQHERLVGGYTLKKLF